MTKKERERIRKAIDLLELEGGRGYLPAMEILYEMIGLEYFTARFRRLAPDARSVDITSITTPNETLRFPGDDA